MVLNHDPAPPTSAPFAEDGEHILPVPPQFLDLEAVSSLLKCLAPAFAAPQGSIPTEQGGLVLLRGIPLDRGIERVEPRLDVIREAFEGSADDREVFVLRHRRTVSRSGRDLGE